LEYKIVDPLEYDKWDEIVLNFNNCTFFHTSAWIKVLKDTYNFTPKSFIFHHGESVKGIVPVLEVNSLFTGKRGVSLPFSDHCDLLLTDDLDLRTTIQNIIQFGEQQKWDYVEFRSLEKAISAEDYSNYYSGHLLDLSRNIDDIYSGMRNSNKRNIKKAVKENVQIEFSNTMESMEEYFRLHCITRKRQGVPPQSFEFFLNIFMDIISSGKGNIVLGLLDKKIIAGAIFFHFAEKVIYKFGASDYKFQNTRANNLLFWEVIKLYSKNGYKSLDFGRTDPDQDGLRKFKLGWGTTEKKITYFKYSIKNRSIINNSQNNGKLQARVLNLMPGGMLKLIGEKLYRHMG